MTALSEMEKWAAVTKFAKQNGMASGGVASGGPARDPDQAEGRGAGRPDASAMTAGARTNATARGKNENGNAGVAVIEKKNCEKTKPNKRENEFMMNLMVLRNSLKRYAPACKDRAKRSGKWTWRNIRIMEALVDRIQDAMISTMPDSRNEYYAAYARNGHYELRIDGPVREAKYILITDIHMANLLEAVMENECVMCLKEGSEIGRCPIREALLEAAPPTEVQEDGRWVKCEYHEASRRLNRGEEVYV